jgi:hypothetical protein
VVIGDYWVQAHAAEHRVFSLDVHDLDHVRALSSISFDERQRPHWLATDGSRIVVVNEPAPTAERRMWMLNIDRATGELALDRGFRDAGSDRPGLAFDRVAWPHGATGCRTAPCSAGSPSIVVCERLDVIGSKQLPGALTALVMTLRVDARP